MVVVVFTIPRSSPQFFPAVPVNNVFFVPVAEETTTVVHGWTSVVPFVVLADPATRPVVVRATAVSGVRRIHEDKVSLLPQ